MPARMDPELPPLPPGLEGLKGVELLRAAYEATRPQPTWRVRSPRRAAPVSQSTPPPKTPRSSRTNPAVGMPAYVDPTDYDIPPGEPPEEEDWR